MTNEQPKWIIEMLAALASPNLDGVDIAGALKIKNEHIPNKLFRYRSINDQNWETLRNGQMWMSSADRYNDPFDSGITVEWPLLKIRAMKKTIRMASYLWLTEEVRQRLLDDLDPTIEFLELMVTGGTTPTEDVKLQVRQKIEKIENKFPAHQNPSPVIQKVVHVCSLAENGASLLMWSHYADQHQGFCVEYDFRRLPAGDINRSRVYPVIYTRKRFDSSLYFAEGISDIKNTNSLFVLLASLHKSPEWSYEQEWRLINISPNANTAGALTEMPKPSHIYLGARTSPENEAKAVALCTDLSIPLSKMKLSDTEYRLESIAYPANANLGLSDE